MIMEKRIVEVTLKLSVPKYFTTERLEECVNTSSVVHLRDLGLDVIETDCKTKWTLEKEK